MAVRICPLVIGASRRSEHQAGRGGWLRRPGLGTVISSLREIGASPGISAPTVMEQSHGGPTAHRISPIHSLLVHWVTSGLEGA